MQSMLKRIEAEITLGTFEYARYFPTSPTAERIKQMHGDETRDAEASQRNDSTPTMECFAEEWFEENQVRWKRSYRYMIRSTLDRHLVPTSATKRSAASPRGKCSSSVPHSPK